MAEKLEQSCEVLGCGRNVISSCFKCGCLLCSNHFTINITCETHYDPLPGTSHSIETSDDFPEMYEVEGGESHAQKHKATKSNKKKVAQKLKNSGKEYQTRIHNKTIPKRILGPTCNIELCKKKSRSCFCFSEQTRHLIFKDFWALGSLQFQREYIVRYIEKNSTKRKTAGPLTRRKNSQKYYLPLNGVRKQVCQFFFLNTLAVSEQVVRTAMSKITSTGVVDKDKRGGRRQNYIERDRLITLQVESHIDRFPRVESHYCRNNSTREYLNGDLTIKKMYSLFTKEIGEGAVASLSTYRKIFQTKNLSFHRPKKDQCGLCMSYHKGTEEVKNNLSKRFEIHNEEKNKFRLIRNGCKEAAKIDPTILCATFDMQQVISLPISMDNAVFYKRRLSVYNLTLYNIASGDCSCYTWHEGISKRGASEVSTAVYHFLQKYDNNGCKKAYLFADGCSGQNKNSVTVATLLYIVNNSTNIEEIELRISVPCHGQNEGDSAHSAISYALKKSGDVHVPSQLNPIFRLARIKKPYDVVTMDYSDFLNFKKLSTDLKLLSIRKDDSGEPINWTEMVEYRVEKGEPFKLFFKNKHTDKNYRSLTLKRPVVSLLTGEISKLNTTPPKIPQNKYEDLVSLTTGDTPVIKLCEHTNFYKSLPH